VDDVIQAQRKGQLRRIGLLTELKEACDPDVELTAVLQLDLAIAKTDAAMRWLDAAEAKIRNSASREPSGVTGAGGVASAVARDVTAEVQEDLTGRERP
jgi:hypothetical protein